MTVTCKPAMLSSYKHNQWYIDVYEGFRKGGRGKREIKTWGREGLENKPQCLLLELVFSLEAKLIS